MAAVIAQTADARQERAHGVFAVGLAADRHGHGIANGRIGDGDVPDGCTGDGRAPALAVEAGICRGSLIWIDNAAQIRHLGHPDVFGVLGRAAVRRKVERFAQLALIADELPCRLIHGTVTVR